MGSINIKIRIKKIKLFYKILHKYRNFTQTRAIDKEQAFFVTKAKKNNISTDECTVAVFSTLKTNLKNRGIVWPPIKSNNKLHILYASMPTNWEMHNIPPQIAEFAQLSLFLATEQGVDVKKDWESIRKEIDFKFTKYVEELHKKSRIDFILSYFSGAQISSGTIEKIKSYGIPVFAFHLDDRRFFYGYKYGDQWSGPAAVCHAYDLNLTNSLKSLVKYRCMDSNALFWPEGANPNFFKPMGTQFKYDVTFCGARYGIRPILVDYLRGRGIKISCFGSEWENGYRSDEELVEIFNSSKIVLGIGYVLDSDDQCLKGRDFEVPSCGAVYLTSYNEDLERVYKIGTEVMTYNSFEDCVHKIIYLLNNDEKCSEIRHAARAAVLDKHTWKHRIKQLIHCECV